MSGLKLLVSWGKVFFFSPFFFFFSTTRKIIRNRSFVGQVIAQFGVY